METEKVYFKSTVPYVVGVRFFIGDPLGAVLSGANPVVAVEKDKLREFKIANKRALINGLLIETTEPSVEWETVNSLTDEEVTDLTKNYMALKNRLRKLDSLPILYKIRENAKANDRTRKTIDLIDARIGELEEGEDNFSITPTEMEGVE